MKEYKVWVRRREDGSRYLEISGLVLSKELQEIKTKVGDLDKRPLNRAIKVKVADVRKGLGI